jgi:hypothetical protein
MGIHPHVYGSPPRDKSTGIDRSKEQKGPLMADDSLPRLLLIVTGSVLRAEELDRPLAYYLQQQVERITRGLDLPVETRVVSDLRWLGDEQLQAFPTISVGGPGVNELARIGFEEIPISLAVDEKYWIQMDPDFADLRVSIWGMDNALTQIAVSVFVDRFLRGFLEHAATYIPDPVDPEDTDE